MTDDTQANTDSNSQGTPTLNNSKTKVQAYSDEFYSPTYPHDTRIVSLSIDDRVDGANWVSQFQDAFLGCCITNGKIILRIFLLTLLVGYTAYFSYSVWYDVEAATSLIVITCVVFFLTVYCKIRNKFGNKLNEKCGKPVERFFTKHWHWMRWWVYSGLAISAVLYLSLVVITEVRQIQSVSGFVFFFVFMFVTSKHPTKIIWRPVIWGYALQFIMAILVLRWYPGYAAVKFISDWITKFINYALDGAAVVFGDPFMMFHLFAFMGMPMLIYTGSVMAILYYCGLTQIAAVKMAWLMNFTMGTTAIETLGVACNIFLHGMDTMMMLSPYLDRMTKSEFNCFQVGAHSTVAGFIFGLFVLFGAPPQHLLSAAVMSAPATIAISKLNYPETNTSITKEIADVKLSRGDDVNVFEAASRGAAVAGKTVGTVLVNYVAFLGLLAFINAALAWIGGLVGFSELSFEWLCSFVMWPFALMIGIELSECREVAKLMGIKVFASEVLAFQEIGRSTAAGALNPRSEALATYALCGFSSISTLAVAVGVWNAICPQRTKLMASLMLRVLTEANISCFTTACVAGLLYTDQIEDKEAGPMDNVINWFSGVLPSYSIFMEIAEF